MALKDGAVLIPGTGHFYLAPVGTPVPTEPTEPEEPWSETGHTSRDEGMQIVREGGDAEPLGTWQAPSLRERVEPVTYAIVWQFVQVDDTNLALYFGEGDTSVAGQFGVSANPTAVESALFVRMVDGNNEVGLYVPKASIRSEDSVELDVESFLSFPVRATLLSVSGSNLMDFLADGLGGESS